MTDMENIKTPRSQNMRMPAEWEKQEAIWLTWPKDPVTWPGKLNEVRSVYINIILAVVNLIPFPPLDGSKMVSSFLNYNAMRKYEQLARFSLIFFILVVFVIHYIFL